MYNEFDPKHYKGKWPCTTKTLWMYFIMHVPMQRLMIPDLWILLSGLLWSWCRIHSRRSLYFCVWMIRWYLNLAQNLKMFQNCLTMLHTTVPTIWMDTALWVSCSAYLSGMGIKYLIFPFLLVIVCGRKKSLNWNWQPPWSGRLCLNFTAKIETVRKSLTKSVQEFRFELSQGIRNQIFFATFVKNIETHIKSNAMTKALKQLIHQQVYHL